MMKQSPDNTTLWINNDKTFFGRSYSDIGGEFSIAGKWQSNEDTIFLKTKVPSLVDNVITLSTNENYTTLIRLVDVERGKPIVGVVLSTGDKTYTTTEKGEVLLPTINTDYLRISYMQMSEPLLASLVKSKTVIVNIDLRKLKSFRVSEHWLLKGKKLIPLDKGFSMFKKCS